MKVLQWAVYPGAFWFRVFGYGLRFSDRRINPPLYSERNGYTKVIRVGYWSILGLAPIRWIG